MSTFIPALAYWQGFRVADVFRTVEPELRKLVRITCDDAGKVHHLGQSEHARPAQQPGEVAARSPQARLESGVHTARYAAVGNLTEAPVGRSQRKQR